MTWWGIRYGKRQLDHFEGVDDVFDKLHVFDSAKDKRGKWQGYVVGNFDEVHADCIIVAFPDFTTG